MSTTTTNLSLVKPSRTDNVSIETLNGNMDILDSEINALKKDYVVSEGTSNGWTYRKWASGIAECWKKVSVSFVTNIAWGAMYRTNAGLYNQNYPFTFASVPILFRSFDSNAGTSWALSDGNTAATTSTTGGTMFANPVNGSSESGYLSFYAIGSY